MPRMRLLFVVAIFLWGTFDALAQPTVPTVQTQLAIEAPTFVVGLGAQKSSVETSVAVTLAEEASRYFSFLAWTTETADGSPELIARMTHESRPLGVAIFLEYIAIVGGVELNLSELPREELYKEFDEQPKDNPSLLMDKLQQTIRTRFNDDSFRDKLQRQFLRQIPLTDTLETDKDLQTILLPVSWEDLGATHNSVLVVEFVARNVQDAPQEGHIRLGPSGRRFDRPGWVQCSVKKFHFPPEDHDAWHTSIPLTLGPSLDELAVYMEVYDQDTRGARGDDGSLADSL